MQQYTIQSHTGPVTVLLSDEDAAARGLTKAKAAPKAKPEPEPEPEPEVEAKAAEPANKARRASNKRAAAVEAAFNAK